MFKRQYNLTNDRGDALVGYQVRVATVDPEVTVEIFADENGTPISSVSGIANIALTDLAGNFEFWVEPGIYTELYSTPQGVFLARNRAVPMQSGPQGEKGDTGGPRALTTLADLKAALTGDDTFIYDSAPFKWTTGNFTGQNDDINIVKSDFFPLSTGAWVRQGADKVAFKARAAAIARTAGDKLSDIIAATDYGTAADGVADDTAKLQQMLNDGAGGLVTLPQRNAVYKITSILTVPADTEIDGQGSMIVSTMTTAKDALVFVNGGGARNLTLVGPYTSGGVFVSGNNGIACRGTNNAPAAPTFVRAPKLENVEVSGYGFIGIFFAYCEDRASSNVTARNCGYMGMNGASCRDVWFNGFTARNIGPGISTDAYGIAMDRLEGGSLVSDPPSYRCGATGVNISGVRAGGNGHGVDSHGGIEIYFEGIVNDCDGAGTFTSSSVSGAPAIGPKRCRARITGNSDHSGIGFFIVGALSGGVIVDYAEDCEIEANLTNYGLDTSDGTGGALYFYGTKGLRVSGNIKNARSCGVVMSQDNVGFDIRLTITDPHSDLFAVPSGVRILANNNKGRISGSYRFENAALGDDVAVSAVRIETGLTGLDIDIEPSSFDGLSASHLNLNIATTTGVRFNGVQTQTGLDSLPVVNTGTEGILDVVFPKRFPYKPTVQVTPLFPVNGGGKPAVVVVRDVLVSATGFRAYAYPADGTTFTASGNVDFAWTAN